MILLLCLIVVAAALSIIALALYEGTSSPPGTPVAAIAAERVAAEPVQWQVAPEKAGEAGEDDVYASREADDGEAVGYVMASFKQGKAMGDGLRLLHSQDALRWEALPPSGKPVLAWTEVDGASVFRDPSVVWDRGLFHLVFTAELCVHQVAGKWRCHPSDPDAAEGGGRRRSPRFGYARSRDLLSWSGVKLVEVPLPDACSLWAPELAALPEAEGGGFVLLFSATRHAGECPPTMAASTHEPYYMTTRDFEAWSPPLPLELPPEDAGRSVIDLFLLLGAAGAPHALFYKLEDNRCERRDYELGALLRGENCTLAIRHASARRVTGPWSAATASGPFFLDAISRPCCEGPAAVARPDGRLLLPLEVCSIG